MPWRTPPASSWNTSLGRASASGSRPRPPADDSCRRNCPAPERSCAPTPSTDSESCSHNQMDWNRRFPDRVMRARQQFHRRAGNAVGTGESSAVSASGRSAGSSRVASAIEREVCPLIAWMIMLDPSCYTKARMRVDDADPRRYASYPNRVPRVAQFSGSLTGNSCRAPKFVVHRFHRNTYGTPDFQRRFHPCLDIHRSPAHESSHVSRSLRR